MRIAEAAKLLGVSTDWLRQLERKGKIPGAHRDLNGHRRYSSEDLARLRNLLFGPAKDSSASRHRGVDDA